MPIALIIHETPPKDNGDKSMIKYFGTPITPANVFKKYLQSKSVLIPYPDSRDYKRAVNYCRSIMIDNGAFTYYRKQITPDWDKYYEFVNNCNRANYFIIPDVIDGTEKENDLLLEQCQIKDSRCLPVFHIHESIKRLKRLMNDFEYICFGSSGEYWQVGSTKWHYRMDQLMDIVCNDNREPIIKIHMLRCLNPAIFTLYPFHSGDSTSLAQNHSKIGIEKMLNYLECFNSPKKYIPYENKRYFQKSFLGML